VQPQHLSIIILRSNHEMHQTKKKEKKEKEKKDVDGQTI